MCADGRRNQSIKWNLYDSTCAFYARTLTCAHYVENRVCIVYMNCITYLCVYILILLYVYNMDKMLADKQVLLTATFCYAVCKIVQFTHCTRLMSNIHINISMYKFLCIHVFDAVVHVKNYLFGIFHRLTFFLYYIVTYSRISYQCLLSMHTLSHPRSHSRSFLNST